MKHAASQRKPYKYLDWPIVFDKHGWAAQRKYRFRKSWFATIVEELYEHKTGKTKWGKVTTPVAVILAIGPYNQLNPAYRDLVKEREAENGP